MRPRSTLRFILAFVSLLNSGALAAQAADEPTDRKTLQGLVAFRARAVVVGDDAALASPIQASLQTRVELCLRRDGIGVLPESDIAAPDVVFVVTVLKVKNVGGTELGYATAWGLEVRQIVHTVRGAFDFVATWRWGTIELSSNQTLQSDLTSDVEAACAQFSNAWLAVNPKSP